MALITGLRVLITTLEYVEKPSVNITKCIFCLGILFKRLKYFSSKTTDVKLITNVQTAIQDREMKKWLSSSI